MADSILSFDKITKIFPGVVALSDVSFEIKKGEIHCLCGENGAGKSTLINLCGGVFPPDSGKIYVNGIEEKIHSSKKSKELGISIVYQEIPLCSNMNISDNIFLGPKPVTKGLLLDKKFMEQETQELLNRLNLSLNPLQEVSSLTIAEQSLIQIARALYAKPSILILDEPTSTLSIDQKDNLFNIIREMRKKYKTTVLYVSHRLEEVMEIGDRVTVLKDGKYIGTKNVKDTNTNEIVNMMVGRDIVKLNIGSDRHKGKKVLKVEKLNREGILNNISFELSEGEILGFSGFVGSRRTELMRAIFGLDKINGGNIYIEGKKTKITSPKVAINNGIGFIPENRKDDAIFPLMSISQNIIALILKELSRFSFISRTKAEKITSDLINELSIKVSDSRNLITSLSGGNQQKVVIARWLSKKPKILICDEPTRGIDVGAKSEIHSLLLGLAEQGVGIIVVSSELPEILSISDRIIVMHEGRITGEFLKEEATEEKILIKAAALH